MKEMDGELLKHILKLTHRQGRAVKETQLSENRNSTVSSHSS